MSQINGFRLTRRRFTALAAAFTGYALAGVAANTAHAQTAWPNGPVQLIVPAAPGGGTDNVARILSEGLKTHAGVSAVIVNSPGGGGAVAAEQVRAAAPDGQTLLFYHTGLLSAYHTSGYAYDPLEYFEVVADLPVGGSYALAVSAASSYKTVEDLIAAAKEKPGRITLGVQIRGASHFMAGLLEADSGAKFRIVEAGSDSDKLVQLQGQQIDAALINTPGTLQYAEKGDLRILGTIAGFEGRDPAAPDAPSLHELGYKNAVYGIDMLVLAPKDTPEPILKAAHDAFAAAVKDETVAERLAKMGMPVSSLSQEDGEARLALVSERLGKTAKELGLK